MINKIKIEILTVDQVTQDYVDWFKNFEITKYSENQFKKFSIGTQREFIKANLVSNSNFLYGIFFEEKHIGNIFIKNINYFHKNAEISFILGDINFWNKGIITYSINEIINKAKFEFKLKKLYAGCAEKNISSKKVLLKNGFKLEGTKKYHLFYNNVWMDQLDFGLLL